MGEPIPEVINLPVIWGDTTDLPVLAANQFALQFGAGNQTPPGEQPVLSISELIFTVGYLAPPVLSGTPEQQRAAAAALESVAVRPLARFSISRAKADELRDVLGRILSLLDAQPGEGGRT